MTICLLVIRKKILPFRYKDKNQHKRHNIGFNQRNKNKESTLSFP